MSPLAHESRADGNIQRGQHQVFSADTALGPEVAHPFRVQLFEGLHGGDAQLVGIAPTEHFLGFDNALQGRQRFRRIDSAQGFDGLHAQKFRGAIRQVAVGDGQQSAEGFTVAGHSDFVDDQGHDERVHVIEQFHQDVAPSYRAACGNLPGHTILRCGGKVFHPAGEKDH